MNILNVVESIKAMSGQGDVPVYIKLHPCQWHGGVAYGGMSEHTTLASLHYRAIQQGKRWELKVTLTHNCPIGSFREKNINRAPYYCKLCAQCIVSTDQGRGMGLPVVAGIVPKIQISIAGPDYERDPATDFDIGDMVLTKYDGWVHKCSSIPKSPPGANKPPYNNFRAHFLGFNTKQTLVSLPFKCKLCKKRIGEEGFDFKKMAAIASVLRIHK
jgi:hypothetical protein